MEKVWVILTLLCLILSSSIDRYFYISKFTLSTEIPNPIPMKLTPLTKLLWQGGRVQNSRNKWKPITNYRSWTCWSQSWRRVVTLSYCQFSIQTLERNKLLTSEEGFQRLTLSTIFTTIRYNCRSSHLKCCCEDSKTENSELFPHSPDLLTWSLP